MAHLALGTRLGESRAASGSIVFAVCATLMVMVAIVYWPTAGFGYVAFDDDLYASENLRVQAGLTPGGIWWAFSTGHASNWHPLTWVSLMLDVTLLGNRPGAHHVVNVVLHGANVLLLLWALVGMTGMFWRSALSAGLLAVHPIHVESVAWVSERKDVLCMLFWLVTMIAYVRYTRYPTLQRYALVFSSMLLALMSKPMAVSLPFVLLLLDVWPLHRVARPTFSLRFIRALWPRLVEKMPMILASVACMVATKVVQRGDGSLAEGRWMTAIERGEMIAVGYLGYVLKLVWPDNLAALYPNLIVIDCQQWSNAHVLVALAAVGTMTAAAIVFAQRLPWLFTGWFWYLGVMIPVIGIVQIGRHTMADRYAYIPFIGLYIIVSWGLIGLFQSQRLSQLRIVAAAAVAGWLGLLAMAAHNQVWVWKDSRTLFAHAVRATSNNWFMHTRLAATLATDGDFDAGLAEMQKAAAICQDCAWVRNEIGEMYLRNGQGFQAEEWFRSALDLDPASSVSHTGLGASLVQQGRVASSIEHFRKGVELAPRLAEARKMLAFGLAMAGEREEAMDELRTAITLNPDRSAEYEALLRVIQNGGTIEPKVLPRP